MSPEGWAFLAALVGGLAGVITTQITQGATTRRALLERQQLTDAKAETAGRIALRGAEAAERAADNSRSVSNGTIPSMLRHLEDQGAMMVRMVRQLDLLHESTGRTVARLDGVQQVVTEHLADHARQGTREDS